MDTQKPSKTTKPEEQQTSAAAEESSANMENSMPLLYTDHIDSFIFDIPSSDDYIYGLNFSLLDSIQPPLTPLDPPSEAVNTPNSTSFSESSSEGVNDEQRVKEKEEEQEQEQEQDKCKQLLKVKKKKEKRKREARVAFMTKSDVEHLDDGYRWRKYGQKAVKNSPFPRSYYRCTTAACGVKKRVERSSEDPSIVVTTYEGQHTHPCPLISRGSLGLTGHSPTSSLLLPSPQHHHHHHFLYHPQQQQQCLPPSSHNPTPSLSFTTNNLSFSSTNFFHQKRYSASQESMLRDHGLLQDIVPSQIQKDHQEQPQEEEH